MARIKGPDERPDTPDMARLLEVINSMDNDANPNATHLREAIQLAGTPTGRGIPDIVGDVVDYDSLEYLAGQRLLRASMVTGRDLINNDRLFTVVMALYLEAFTAGALFTAGQSVTRDQLAQWAGGELTADELSRLLEAIPNSSIPDAVGEIMASIRAEIDQEGEPS